MLELIRDLQQRMSGLVSRGRITRVDDTTGRQRVQVAIADDMALDGCERPQPYGFSSVALSGATAFLNFIGGRRDHPIAMIVDDPRTRKKNLQPGEVCIYTDQGDYIIIRRGGAIEINAAASVTVTSPSVKFTGSVEIDGGLDVKGDMSIEGSSGLIVANGDVVAGAIDLKHHTHTGVTSGGSQTGPPI